MGAYRWGFTLAAVALLLDPTFADVLVQPGYGQPAGQVRKTQVSQGRQQPVGNPQQNYPQQQNPLQLLQQQHALQQQYLQYQHQQERNQLLQLQQQQLQQPALRDHQTGGNDVVGMPWGLPRYPMLLPTGPIGGLHGGRLFSLGPLGVNSFTLGGLGGGLLPPMLMSPHQPEMTGSTQFQKSVDGATQTRTKRDVRDPGDAAGRKYRQKTTRPQQDGMASNSPVKSKSDASPQNAETSNANDQVVGSSNKEDEETVGSSLLDPFGLVDKTSDLIDGLKSGHLGHGGHLPGLPNWLNKGSPEKSQLEEHIVNQPHQYRNSQQGNAYDMMGQQRSSAPVVGGARHPTYPGYYNLPPPPPQLGPYGPYGLPPPYGAYPQSYPGYGPSLDWLRQSKSMGNQGSKMPYQGHPMMVGAGNPAAQNGYEKATAGAQNPGLEKAQMTGKSPMGKDPMIGASNPAQISPKQASWANPGGYDQTVGSPLNQMDNLYQLANAAQPMLGRLFDSNTGNSGPGAWSRGATPMNYQPNGMGGQNPTIGNPMMNSFYDQGRQNYYGPNDGPQRHRHYDNDGFYGNNYGHHHNHGGFDRIYEAIFEDSPFDYDGGNSPYMHNRRPYIF